MINVRYFMPVRLSRISFIMGHLCTCLISPLLRLAGSKHGLTFPFALGTSMTVVNHFDFSSTPSRAIICCLCNISSSSLRDSLSVYALLPVVPVMAAIFSLLTKGTTKKAYTWKIYHCSSVNVLLALLSTALFVLSLKYFYIFIMCIQFVCLTLWCSVLKLGLLDTSIVSELNCPLSHRSLITLHIIYRMFSSSMSGIPSHAVPSPCTTKYLHFAFYLCLNYTVYMPNCLKFDSLYVFI